MLYGDNLTATGETVSRSPRQRKPPRFRPGARRRRARSAPRRRWPLLAAGLVLAAVALYALLTLRREPPGEAIDEESRAKLESVLREAGE